jgi:hypothetical protein
MTSQLAIAPSAAPKSAVGPCPSREELAELERELDLYLTFWAHARDERATRSKQHVR